MVMGPRRIRCEAGHAYTCQELLLEAQQTSASATWEAVRALENRDQIARRAMSHAEMSSGQRRAGSAAAEGQTTSVLRFYAGAIDANTPNSRPESSPDQRRAVVVPLPPSRH